MMSETQTAEEVVNETVDPPVVEAEAHEGPTAEEAMAQMRRELEATQAERDAALKKAEKAGAGMMTANEVAINEAIQNTEAQLARQRTAYRAAREGGDLDAEQLASEESAVLRLRLDALKRDKERMKAVPPPQQQQQNQSRIPGPAARQWMNDHPKINSDPAYAHAAESAHNRAIANGHEPESHGYFQSINADLEKSFGADHGRDAVSQPRQPAAPAAKPRTPAASSYATPPGRGNAGARPGTDVKAIAARLGVSESDVVEAADICKMSVDAYCKKQAEILAEQGGKTITYGDGAVFR